MGPEFEHVCISIIVEATVAKAKDLEVQQSELGPC